ncbi:MAG: prepilin-type N-terminal cleavage/methylation domain-containing protein [Proteobacteria bacterium]|nr:prepilin-type N-terminal cleavage/methylation domain-containing protein [Desulfobacula sp.]MBU3953354.1 prepilin-type N-terminal cleavage/methylation domain-containing protein [Pseudomonadota bacterium]MBU4131355.1 prepilin-type N-terminal cleavage/methylation domain-containing protein [Pseudomonadota bacterium]
MRDKTLQIDTQGFTLIEILVAMVIFSVTLLTLFSAFTAFLSSGTLVKNEVIRNECFRLGMKTIFSDLEQLFILQYPRYSKPEFNDEPDAYRFEGTRSDGRGEQFSHLSFASLNHAKTKAAPGNGAARIAYYVHSRGDRFDLLRSDTLAPYPKEGDPCSDPVLFKDITGFKLTYTDVNGDDHDTWDSDSKDFDFILPAMVHIQLDLKQNGITRSLVTAISLPANREAIK